MIYHGVSHAENTLPRFNQSVANAMQTQVTKSKIINYEDALLDLI